MCCICCRLEDDERLDALLDHLEQRAPSLQHQQQQQQEHKQPVRKVVSGAAVSRAGRGRHAAAAGSRRPADRSAAGAGSRRVSSAGRQSARQADQRIQQQEEEPLDQDVYREEEEDPGIDAGDVASGGDSQYGVYGSPGLAGEESAVSSSVSAPSSIKSTLAAELAAVRRQLADLELLAGQKAARALAGLPGAAAVRQQLAAGAL